LFIPLKAWYDLDCSLHPPTRCPSCRNPEQHSSTGTWVPDQAQVEGSCYTSRDQVPGRIPPWVLWPAVGPRASGRRREYRDRW